MSPTGLLKTPRASPLQAHLQDKTLSTWVCGREAQLQGADPPRELRAAVGGTAHRAPRKQTVPEAQRLSEGCPWT